MLRTHATDAQTDTRTDEVKTVYPPQTKFAGGITQTKFAGGIIIFFKDFYMNNIRVSNGLGS